MSYDYLLNNYKQLLLIPTCYISEYIGQDTSIYVPKVNPNPNQNQNHNMSETDQNETSQGNLPFKTTYNLYIIATKITIL